MSRNRAIAQQIGQAERRIARVLSSARFGRRQLTLDVRQPDTSLRGSMLCLTKRVGSIGIFLVFLSPGGCQDPVSPGSSPDTTNTSAQPSNAVTAIQPAKDPAAAPDVLGQETAGIGVALANEQQDLVIKSILPDSAAALNNAIRVGDRVMAVAENNKPAVKLQGKTIEEAVRLIRGAKGTTVRLTLVAAAEDDSQARVVSLVRGELKELSGWGDGVLLPAGSDAPNIQMTAVPEMESQHLADFTGKVVVLEFWATWCMPCQEIMAELQSYPEKHPEWKDKVVLIAASIDEDQDALINHLNAKGWNKTHNVQVGTEAKKAYHVGAVSTQYVIDQQGKIVAADHALDVSKIVNGLNGLIGGKAER